MAARAPQTYEMDDEASIGREVWQYDDESCFDEQRKPAARAGATAANVTQTNIRFFFGSKKQKLAPIDNAGRRQCSVCGKWLSPQGLKNHETACLERNHGVRNITRSAPSGGVRKRGARTSQALSTTSQAPSRTARRADQEEFEGEDQQHECQILEKESSDDEEETTDEDEDEDYEYEFTDLAEHGDDIDSDVDSVDLEVKPKVARFPKYKRAEKISVMDYYHKCNAEATEDDPLIKAHVVNWARINIRESFKRQSLNDSLAKEDEIRDRNDVVISKTKETKRRNSSKFPKMEFALAEHISNLQAVGVPVETFMVREEAKDLVLRYYGAAAQTNFKSSR
jgi:hypothetical protein